MGALIFASLVAGVAGRSAISSPMLASRGGSLLELRGGAEPSDAILQATYACNALSSSVLADAQGEVAALRKVVTGGEAIPAFGEKVDALIADALDKFETETPKGDAEVTALYQSKGDELRAALVTSLEPAFTQQICLLKDAAMEQFKKGLLGDGEGSEALAASEAAFVREGTASVPSKAGWGFKLERASLVGAMQTILNEQKKAQAAKLASAGQMQTALSYLRACFPCFETRPARRSRAPGQARSSPLLLTRSPLVLPALHPRRRCFRAPQRCSSSRCRRCRRSTLVARAASGILAPRTARPTQTLTCLLPTSRVGATCRSRWCRTRAPTCSGPMASPTAWGRPTSACRSTSTFERDSGRRGVPSLAWTASEAAAPVRE